jgi:DNA polymerase sigma
MIGEWLAEIDGLYRVLIILKYILFKRGLSSTYKGGISPYCLLVMIKAYIRQAQLVEPLPTSLLEGFLRYYGVQFD